jgi:hypothetical protein
MELNFYSHDVDEHDAFRRVVLSTMGVEPSFFANVQVARGPAIRVERFRTPTDLDRQALRIANLGQLGALLADPDVRVVRVELVPERPIADNTLEIVIYQGFYVDAPIVDNYVIAVWVEGDPFAGTDVRGVQDEARVPGMRIAVCVSTRLPRVDNRLGDLYPG